MSLREHLTDRYGDEDMLFADGFDDAIIGVTTFLVVAYDANKVVQILQDENGWDHDEAVEYAEHNIFSAYVGEKTPMFVWVEDDTNQGE